MRVAVTGMRGSLGRVIFERLSAEGYDVVGLSRGAPPSWGSWLHEDYRGPPENNTSLQDASVVIHCAGGGFAQSKEALFQANFETTDYLVRALNHAERSATLILISSIAAGGPSDFLGRPRRLEDTDEPHSYYGRSKLAAEKSLLRLHRRHTAITLRLPTCHGGYEYRWAKMFKHLDRGLIVLPPPMQMSHIHVRDVADTLVNLIIRPQAYAQTWNLCAPESFCWTDLPAMVERLLQRSIRSVSMPRLLVSSSLIAMLNAIEETGIPPLRYTDKLRDGQFHDWRVDGSRLHHRLNYTPRRGLEEGLKDMLER